MATWPSYATAVWPSGKPQNQAKMQRTPMEHGPAKQAVIGGGGRMVEWPMVFHFASQADWRSFESWFYSGAGAASGGAFFNWTNPYGDSVTARVKGGDISDAEPTSVTLGQWRLRCVLEHWA